MFYTPKSLIPLKYVARLRRIVSVFAKYGFAELLQGAKLGRYFWGQKSDESSSQLTHPEKLRRAFEELGPTFIKLGQVLASRPDLVPLEFCEEFKRLHDQVKVLPFVDMERVLASHFGSNLDSVFKVFHKDAIAAASIAQVYRAELHDGTRVVVKVQRPGVREILEEDLGVLRILAGILDKYVEEVKLYNLPQIVDEFSRSLNQETNFIVEANNIRRFIENFKEDSQIKIPEVYATLSGRRVLVMEELLGIPLSHKNALDQEGILPEEVLRVGLRSYLKSVFRDGLFHGDLHAGNFFVLPGNRIGLIDFGLVGRLNNKTKSAIAAMLIALATEDYDALAYEYIDLAPWSPHVDGDKFAQELRDLIAPYYGLSLQHVNVGKLFMDSASIAARHKLQLPTELVMFFKSIVTIEGMGRVIMKDFDFLSYSIEFAGELIKSRYEPDRVMHDFLTVGKDLSSLLLILPRQLKQIIRQSSSPDYAFRFQSEDLKSMKRSVDNASNLLFLGLVIASLVLSATVITVWGSGHRILGLPILAFIGYTFASVLGFFAFFNYWRK